MRKLTVTLIFAFLSFVTFGQPPHAINYQAVAHGANGQIIPEHSIYVRFSILDGSINGNIVYQETQITKTNPFGLFSLAIGKGTVTQGSFDAINWAVGDKFLKVEIGPGDIGKYDLQGTSQLLSVPYALYAEKTNLVATNNTIAITNGGSIAGNYQGGRGISITGNTISGNYKAGNAISITGDSINANYKAGKGVIISKDTINTINASYIGGNGITISGDSISESNPNNWTPDQNGIHNISGNVGIGTNSSASTALEVQQANTGGNSAAVELTSADTWHTAFTMLNSTTGSNNRYSFSLGGIGNTEVGTNNFGILNHHTVQWAFIINGANNNIGIGMNNIKNNQIPKSKLHVFNGDVNIDQIGSGIIMKSPNGSCWRVTVSDTGTLVVTSIPCL